MQHGRKLLLPKLGIGRQPCGEIHHAAALNGSGSLLGIEQVGDFEQVRVMYLARPAAHQLEFIAVVALEFARQLGGDLPVGAQYGLHSCS
ncbi:hypothetical protein SDC9_207194 [bioreactor metagenome]|uniref:Uncharacterized protein n=1 Tax=bioreactor metagenome TaxID=1076179 RepID=A0A645JIM1_9ZZZZ